MEERDFVFKIPMVYHKKHHCQSFDKILGWSSLREPAFSPQRSALLMITLGAEKLPLPPPPFFFLSFKVYGPIPALTAKSLILPW